MNAKEIGKRLVELRGSKTQEQVANAVGISVSALSMYECGERIPRDPIKIALTTAAATIAIGAATTVDPPPTSYERSTPRCINTTR